MINWCFSPRPPSKSNLRFNGNRVVNLTLERICPTGRYLLHGRQIDYYEDGRKQHRVTYANGRKTGKEVFWSREGNKAWTWQRNLKNNHGIWTHYWPNGNRRIESVWNLMPKARDLKRSFYGYVASGPSRQWDEQGNLVATHRFVNGALTESRPWSGEVEE